MRRKSISHNKLLIGTAGFLAGFMTLAQLNLQEVIRFDRFQHLSVSFILFLMFYFIFSMKKPSFILPAAAALAVGYVKEFTDPTFQQFDIFANFTGVSVGIMFIFALSLFVAPVTSQMLQLKLEKR